MIDTKQIEEQIKSSINEKINQTLNDIDLTNQIFEVISTAVDQKINAVISQLVSQIIKKDSISQYIEKQITNDLQTMMETVVRQRASETVARSDIGSLINEKIIEFAEKRLKQGDFPENFIPSSAINWTNDKLNSNNIEFNIIENFNSTGINDVAETVNLTVMDGEVVVENNLISKNLHVVENAEIKKLTVKDDLHVYGEVIFHSTTFSDNIKSYISNQIREYKLNTDIDLLGKPLTSNEQILIEKDSLGPGIVKSNLRKLGRLQDLEVVGDVDLGETLTVSNRRVGINTDEPSGALTVWDEETEFTVKKYKKRNTFIGTTRDCDLSIGVNSNPVLTVNSQGIATKSIRIENTTISSSIDEPSHVGSPGDIVINVNPDPKLPWAYRCVGGKNWMPLYSK